MMSGKGKIRKFTPSQKLPPDRKYMQNHTQRAKKKKKKSRIRWTLDDCVLQPLLNTGAALPNYDEIIQLTEGGKLEEQKEPELTTPEIPRELIGWRMD